LPVFVELTIPRTFIATHKRICAHWPNCSTNVRNRLPARRRHANHLNSDTLMRRRNKSSVGSSDDSHAGGITAFTGTGWVRPRGDLWSGTGGASIPIFQGIADKVSYGMDTPVTLPCGSPPGDRTDSDRRIRLRGGSDPLTSGGSVMRRELIQLIRAGG
jgi:hypothetical protein